MRTNEPRTRLLFLLVLPALVVGTLYAPERARSFPIYPPLIPNRATATAADGTQKPCITCHNNPDGGLGCVASGGMNPCLNPFGTAFRLNGRIWNATLANLDSDGDGFTNGQELQDPTGSWVLFSAAPGNPNYVTRPGFNDSSPGYHDADGDRYCWFGVDTNQDGDCLDAGENTTDYDCDDSSVDIRPGVAELCSDLIDNDCNGFDTLSDVACEMVVDRDGDGYCPTGQDLNGDRTCGGAGEQNGTVDCGPDDVLVSPAAYENCVDGNDNDCDGATDTADTQCNGDADADQDGFCPIGQDLNADGDCLDAILGETTAPSDCDDRSNTISPGSPEICGDAADNDCDQKADFDDPDCANQKDADGDGYCPSGKDANGDGDCVDFSLGDTASTVAGWDCNDANASIFSLAEEICTDAVDQDCDGNPNYLLDEDCFGYRDRDGDGYCEAGGYDTNADGDCADNADMSPLADCDDTSPNAASINPLATETCFNGVDDDCNGNADAQGASADPKCLDYADWDFDGYCAIGEDLNGDHDCADAGEQTSAVDMAPNDATVSPGNHESCFDNRDNDQDGAIDLADSECVNTVDADGDGYCPVGRDLNGDGDCADTGENYRASDCDDTDPNWGPQNAETYDPSLPLDQQRCFDFDDNDCDGKIDLGDPDCDYLFDRDGDHVCGHGVDDTNDGDCLDAEEQRFGEDCADDDPTRASTRIEVCTNGKDDDCDGAIDTADTNCQCQADSQCGGGDACHIPRCRSNLCILITNTDCIDGGIGAGQGGCSVAPSGPSGTGSPTPESPLAVVGFATVAAVLVRRRLLRGKR